MASPDNVRHVIRSLIRAVDRHITSRTQNKQWRVYVLGQCRADLGLTDQAEIKSRLQLAGDYTELVKNVASHRTLLRSYNIGIDPDERTKDMVTKTANRVGFAMPNDPRTPRPSKPTATATTDLTEGGKGPILPPAERLQVSPSGRSSATPPSGTS